MALETRHSFALVSLGLLLGSCAGPHGSESCSGCPPRQSSPAGEQPAELAVGRIDPLPAATEDSMAHYDITLEQIRRHVRNWTAVVIDARSPEQFALGHVSGAMNVPASEIDSNLSLIEQTVARDQLIIIYCESPSCGSADMVYEKLSAQGFTKIRVYHPGWRRLATAPDLQDAHLSE